MLPKTLPISALMGSVASQSGGIIWGLPFHALSSPAQTPFEELQARRIHILCPSIAHLSCDTSNGKVLASADGRHAIADTGADNNVCVLFWFVTKGLLLYLNKLSG